MTFAGSETTRNAISGGLIALLEHPDQLAMLRRDPEAMRPAVEEILRWTSPVAYFARRATRATEIRGVPIAEGDRVTLWYPSANRDEDVFDDPFPFDITRTPNNHVAFGGGGPHTASERTSPAGRSRSCSRNSSRGPPTSRSSRSTYSGLSIDNPVLGAVGELPSACPDGTQASEVCGDANHVVASVATATTEELPGSRRGDGGKTGPCV